MALKSKGKQLSFEILSSASSVNSDAIIDRSNSDPLINNNNNNAKSNRNRKRKEKRKKSTPNSPPPYELNPIFENGANFGNGELDESPSISHSFAQSDFVCELREDSLSAVSQVSQGELRQRNVSSGSSGGGGAGGGESIPVAENQEADVKVEVEVNSRPNFPNGKLETSGYLDWRRFMAEQDPTSYNEHSD